MKAVTASVLLAVTVMAAPALARSGLHNAAHRQGNPVYPVYQGNQYLGSDPDPQVQFDLEREAGSRNGGYWGPPSQKDPKWSLFGIFADPQGNEAGSRNGGYWGPPSQLGLDVPPSLLARADEVIEWYAAGSHHAARQRGRGVAAGGESTAAGDAGDAPGMRDVLLGFRAAVLALLWRIDSSDRLPWA